MSEEQPAPLQIRLVVNGHERQVSIEPRQSLAEVLRERLGLTGTKVSCDVQICGACTVLVDGLPVSSCTFLAHDAQDREILTIEGLAPAPDRLHPIQQAFIEMNAFQCGFCTSGMILSAKSLLDERPAASEEEIVAYMNGNLCRCTGYRPIVAAIQRAQRELAAERSGGRPAGAATPHAAAG